MSRIRLGIVLLSGGFLAACGGSSGATSPSGNGGANSSGGQASGSGGAAMGGAATGGAAMGGAAMGGAAMGGAATGGAAMGGAATGGSAGSGGAATGGASGASSGGAATGGANTAGNGSAGQNGGGAGSPGGLPALHVDGPLLKSASNQTVILRGTSLIDIGTLYANGGQSVSGITTRMDKTATAGVQGHVVRLPVYPPIVYNGTVPTCSPVPYPVSTGPSAKCTPKSPLSTADYVSKVLKPAVDYATTKGLYVIIDYHQIDNASSGTSAADAKTFWADIAPRFASYNNVLFEAFNEPIDTSASWATLKPVVQGLIDTIRAGAPNNVIIVPSNIWDQVPGDAASDPPTGTNFMYTAHIYPTNWKQAFQTQLATAVTKAPVFVSEWGYNATDPATFGTGLQTTLDGNGASWTAWVTDNSWGPPMFSDMAITQLNDFGTLVKTWLAAKATDHWVQ